MRFTLALPRWDGDAAAVLQHWREQHDPQAQRIGPHLLLLWGIDTDESVYRDHVMRVAQRHAPTDITLPVAVPWCTGNHMARTLLLVERGLAPLIHLHRALYGGPLAPWRALDQPFTPHVQLAEMEDALMAQALADRWNAQGLMLSGVVDRLTVGRLRAGRWETEMELPLGAPP